VATLTPRVRLSTPHPGQSLAGAIDALFDVLAQVGGQAVIQQVHGGPGTAGGRQDRHRRDSSTTVPQQ
jgi:hypothetical protein